VLRVLRSLHGRNDADTTYGSHMATHMAIGVLSLGCGTQTFTTSNLAIASLLVAFYPVFPDAVQDNKSHLQAFRHFWVLATDPRCLVTKDVASGVPVSVPLSIRLSKGNKELSRTTPCLLPPLDEVARIQTISQEFWNLDLDFGSASSYVAAFKKTQTLYLRRRPGSASPFGSTLLALGARDTDDNTGHEAQPLEWLFDSDAVPSLSRFSHLERGIVLDRGVGGPDVSNGTATVVDARLMLEQALKSGRREDLLGLKGLFAWSEERGKLDSQAADKADGSEQASTGGTDDKPPQKGGENKTKTALSWNNEAWLRYSVIEELKGGVWLAGRE
jgi:anaphase-promoting complex subunit 1